MEAVEVANAVNSLLHLSSSDQQSLLARIISSLLINALMTVTWMALMTPILKWTLMLNLVKLIFIHLRIPVMSMGMQTHCSTVVHVQGDVQTMYLFRAIWEFGQSRDCVAHSQNPEIVFQSRDCAV